MTEVVIKNAGIFHAIAHCAHSQKDRTIRPRVHNVLIEKIATDRARIIAMDGRVLACAPVEADWATDGPIALLPTAELMKTTRPVKGRATRLTISDTVYEVLDVASGTTSYYPRAHNGYGPADYPDWYPMIHNILDRKKQSVAYAGGFAVGEIEHVAKIGKLLHTAGALAYPSMIFDGAHGDGPCRIVYGNFDALLYLMPYRDHADPSRRDADIEWLR